MQDACTPPSDELCIAGLLRWEMCRQPVPFLTALVYPENRIEDLTGIAARAATRCHGFWGVEKRFDAYPVRV